MKGRATLRAQSATQSHYSRNTFGLVLRAFVAVALVSAVAFAASTHTPARAAGGPGGSGGQGGGDIWASIARNTVSASQTGSSGDPYWNSCDGVRVENSDFMVQYLKDKDGQPGGQYEHLLGVISAWCDIDDISIRRAQDQYFLYDPLPVQDPRTIAQAIFDAKRLPSPEISANPSPSANQDLFVNHPTWVWAGAGNDWYNDGISVSVSLPAIGPYAPLTVTTTASPTATEWRAADGANSWTSCGRGVPYSSEHANASDYPAAGSGGCAVTFRRPSTHEADGLWNLDSRFRYAISYTTSAGGGGNLGGTYGPVQSVPARVVEVQSVNVS